MGVYKRRKCCSCGAEYQDAKEKKVPDRCKKCGGITTYSEKWYFSVYSVNRQGKKVLVRKAVSKYKAEAQAAEAAALAERAEGGIVQPKASTTFEAASKLFDQWISDRVNDGNIADSTARYYRMRLEAHLKPAFGGADLVQIDKLAVRRHINARRKEVIYQKDDVVKHPSNADINRDIATLKKLMAVAVDEKLIRVNPLDGLEMLKENNKRERFLTDEEITLLLDECAKEKYPRHLHTIVLLGLETGLRKEGCLGLKWSDVDFGGNEIKRTVKGGKVVRIPMTKKLREELSAWRNRDKVIEISGYTFPSPKKAAHHMLVTSRFGFEAACKEVGIENFTFHDLRHTFATHFIKTTKDISLLAMLLGHSSTYISERYVHLIDDHAKEGMRKFEERQSVT